MRLRSDWRGEARALVTNCCNTVLLAAIVTSCSLLTSSAEAPDAVVLCRFASTAVALVFTRLGCFWFWFKAVYSVFVEAQLSLFILVMFLSSSNPS